MPLHPTHRRLNRYADRELHPRQHARVSRHLEWCAGCRRTVLGVRTLVRDAGTLREPPLPQTLRARVLDSAASEPLAILPVADPLPHSRRWQRLVWLGAGVVIIAIAARVALAPPELRSEASALTFAPELPQLGQAVEVTYRATPRLAGEDRLRLRARYRRPGDPQDGRGIPQVEAATLTQQRDGSFRGTVQLPTGVVYAAFAVEDEAAQVVDGRGPLGWELLTGIDGVPSYDGLVQRANEAMRRDLRVALETITEATERYPDRVGAWQYRSVLDQAAFGTSAYDSIQPVHMARMRSFDDSLRKQPLEPEAAWSMYLYARSCGDSVTARWWNQRLLGVAPSSVPALRLRALAIAIKRKGDPDLALRELEVLWADAGPPNVALPEMAFEFAREVRAAAAMAGWARRWLALEPWRRPDVIRDMIYVPALHDTALAWLDHEEAALHATDSARRPLYRSRAAQRREDAQALRELLGLKGRILLARGEVESGLALIDSATAKGWGLALFRNAADARLAAGDTSGAVEMLARLEADPGYDDPDVAARGLALVTDGEWDTRVGSAAEYMLDETIAEASARVLPDSLRVTEPNGVERDLRDLTGGQVAVVAFFWPGCRTCIASIDSLQQLTQLPQPARVVLVSRSQVAPADLDLLRSAGIELPVVVDAGRGLTTALESWGTPDYFVLDGPGLVRFSHTTLADIPRQVFALSEESEPLIT
jgi:hypothetical protein